MKILLAPLDPVHDAGLKLIKRKLEALGYPCVLLPPDITVVPTPSSQSQFYTHDRGATLDQLRGLAREYMALAAYWWRGWI